MNTLQNRFNHLFDDSFFRPGRSDDDLSLGAWHPVVDMYDEDDRVVIKAELPGVDKKDIAVDVKDRVLRGKLLSPRKGLRKIPARFQPAG
jgi:HSP20 family protein